MSKQVVTFTAPYGVDNEVNKFGDFDRIVVQFSRDTEKKTSEGELPEVEVEVRLESVKKKRKTGPVILNDEESGQVLLSFFLQNSKRKEVK